MMKLIDRIYGVVSTCQFYPCIFGYMMTIIDRDMWCDVTMPVLSEFLWQHDDTNRLIDIWCGVAIPVLS